MIYKSTPRGLNSSVSVSFGVAMEAEAGMTIHSQH